MLQITVFETRAVNFVDAMLAKQKPGYDPSKIDLVVYVRDKAGWTTSADDLARDVVNAGPKYKSVWAIMNDDVSEKTAHILQLFPDVARESFDVKHALAIASPPDFIREPPRFGKITNSEDEYHLPLPSCPKCGT